MTTPEDIAALEANIKHLERELKNAQMTLRDQFAMAAMQGHIAGCLTSRLTDDEFDTASVAYIYADAMMEARNG